MRNKKKCLGSVSKEQLTASGLSFRKDVSKLSAIAHKHIAREVPVPGTTAVRHTGMLQMGAWK